MRPTVAWYVHHHGRGHLSRMLAIAPHLDADIMCFSSLPRPDELPSHCSWMQLERDDTVEPGHDAAAADPTSGGLLHWAPLAHGGHRRRLLAIAAAIERTPVAAFVVDVSVEVVLFARLLGIPPVLITQPGARDDEPHRLAFRAAASIIAPWPSELMQPPHLSTLPTVVNVGGISRFEGRPALSPRRDGVLVLGGAGGSAVTAAQVAAAAASTPSIEWKALGVAGVQPWSPDPWDELTAAHTVVTFAGQGSIADIAAAGSRAIVIPQDRPFDEQRHTASALESAGLALVEPGWPEPSSWPALLDRARELTPDWSRWAVAGAAARAADEIARVAQAGAS